MDHRWGDIEIEPPEEHVLTLWSIPRGSAVTSHQNLARDMSRLNFKPLEVNLLSGLDSEESGICWKAYRFISDDVPRSASMAVTPRLPYPVIEGAHPLVFLRFLEDIDRWVPDQALVSTVFSLRTVPLKESVKSRAKVSTIYGDWDGMVPCSWLKEQGVIVYRVNTLDYSTRLRGFEGYPEYAKDCTRSIEENLNDHHIAKDTAINSVFRRGWNFVKVLGLWDVVHSSNIETQEELRLLMLSEGFSQTQITYPNAEDDDDYKDDDDSETKMISYRFGDVGEADWPSLPYPDLETCHPTVYLKFLKDMATCIGYQRTSDIVDIRGRPLTSQVLERHGYDGLLPTVWKGQSRYKYSSSSLDAAVRVDDFVLDLEEFMLQTFRHLEGDITEYKNDLAEYRDLLLDLQIHDEVVSSGDYDGYF